MPFQRKRPKPTANGAISILNALHVSEICFGSEDGQIENFYNTISVQKNEEETLIVL